MGNANHEVPADMWNVKHLNRILRNGKGVSSPGLGGWTYAHFKKLPPRGVDFLHSLFMLCVICGRVPKHWLNAKLVVIPKGDAGFDLDAMRPITIEVTALRIFHKWLLKCGEITFDNSLRTSLGVYLSAVGIRHGCTPLYLLRNARMRRTSHFMVWQSTRSSSSIVSHIGLLVMPYPNGVCIRLLLAPGFIPSGT